MRGIPIQEIADIAMVAGNAVNIVMNFSGIGIPQEKSLGDKAIRVGELRRNFHVFTSLGTAGVIFGTELYLNSKYS